MHGPDPRDRGLHVARAGKGKPVTSAPTSGRSAASSSRCLPAEGAFGGATLSETIAAVDRRSPTGRSCPRSCRRRWSGCCGAASSRTVTTGCPDIAAARLDIDDASPALAEAPSRRCRMPPPRLRLGWAAAGAARRCSWGPSAPDALPHWRGGHRPGGARRALTSARATRTGVGHDVAISRDGLRVVFVGAADGLFVRQAPLAGT